MHAGNRERDNGEQEDPRKPFTHKGTGGQKPVLDIKPFVHAGNQITPNDSNVTQSKTIHGSGEQGNRLKTAHGPPPKRPPRENQVAPPRGPPRRPQPTPAPKAGASGVHAERERFKTPPHRGTGMQRPSMSARESSRGASSGGNTARSVAGPPGRIRPSSPRLCGSQPT